MRTSLRLVLVMIFTLCGALALAQNASDPRALITDIYIT
jgi:hypothetical protein